MLGLGESCQAKKRQKVLSKDLCGDKEHYMEYQHGKQKNKIHDNYKKFGQTQWTRNLERPVFYMLSAESCIQH